MIGRYGPTAGFGSTAKMPSLAETAEACRRSLAYNSRGQDLRIPTMLFPALC